MRYIKFLIAVALLCTGCSWVGREAMRFQVRETASRLAHPPESVAVLTVDNFAPEGSSDTCFSSDKFILIGSPLSSADINDYYNRQFGPEWTRESGPDYNTWLRDDSLLSRSVTVRYRNSVLEYHPPYREAVIRARAQYSTTYVLGFISYTTNTCKGG